MNYTRAVLTSELLGPEDGPHFRYSNWRSEFTSTCYCAECRANPSTEAQFRLQSATRGSPRDRGPG